MTLDNFIQLMKSFHRMTCRIRCNISESQIVAPQNHWRMVFPLKMLGGRLSPDSSLSALEIMIQILPSLEKTTSKIYENTCIKAENASSKHSTFRSRNMGFGMCKKNKLRTFKWLWNTSTLSFLDENSGGSSVFTINQQGKVATLLSDGLKLVQHFLSGDIQPPVLAASTAGIIPHLVPKQSTGIRDLYNVMSRVREHLETTPHGFLCDFCCVTPGRI